MGYDRLRAERNSKRQRTQASPIIPGWMPGDEVEIIDSGMRAICLAPVDVKWRMWTVELCTLAGVKMGRLAQVPATGLRVWDARTARYGRTDPVPG